jgi:hypothetical protein
MDNTKGYQRRFLAAFDSISGAVEVGFLDYVSAFGEWILANLDKIILRRDRYCCLRRLQDCCSRD